MITKKGFALFFWISLTYILSAQDTIFIDSLNRLLTIEKDPIKRSFILTDLSWEYATFDFEKAKETANQALQIGLQEKDINTISRAMYMDALAYDYQADYGTATKKYFETLNYCEENNVIALKGDCLNAIGNIYYFSGKMDQAVKYYEQSLQIDIQRNDRQGIADSYLNLASILKNSGDYEKGIIYCKNAQRIYEEIGDTKSLSHAYENLGNIQLKQKKFQEALLNFEKDLEISTETNNTQGVVSALKRVGTVNDSLGNHQKAILYYQKALHIQPKEQSKQRSLEIYQSLANSYASIADYKNALIAFKKYKVLNDSLFNEIKHVQILEVEEKYQTKKKEEEIKALNLTITNRQVQQKLWITASLLSTLMAIMIAFFLYTNRKKSRKLAKSLDERDTLLKEIHHRVKNNLQIVTSMLNMQSRYIKDENTIEAFNDTKNRIRAMSLIHQKLYQNNNLKAIDMKDYIDDLASTLAFTYHLSEKSIILHTESIALDIDTATPLGLLINEIISNAIKHAKNPNSPLKIRLDLYLEGEYLMLKVQDNGAGLPKDFDPKKSKSYGMKLVSSIGKQLDADIRFENKNGLLITVSMVFPLIRR